VASRTCSRRTSRTRRCVREPGHAKRNAEAMVMWHLRTLRQFDIAALKRDDPIDTLREWSVRYGMANPDDLDLVRGGRRT
jgi:hypothetical protein